MRFTIIVAALIGAVAAAPPAGTRASLEDRATAASDCSPTGATAGSVTCNDPAYTGNKLKLNNQAFNLGGCAASAQAKALCEKRDN